MWLWGDTLCSAFILQFLYAKRESKRMGIGHEQKKLPMESVHLLAQSGFHLRIGFRNPPTS